MSNTRRTAEEYLIEPYSIVLVADKEAGGYTATIGEFPGCLAEGETAEEAVANVREAAIDWMEAAQRQGQTIPEPTAVSNTYSGKIALRLPRSLHRKAVEIASAEGTSLNQFLVATVAEKIGRHETQVAFRESVDRIMSRMYQPAQQSSWGSILGRPMTFDLSALYTPIACRASTIGTSKVISSAFDADIYFPQDEPLTVMRVSAKKANKTVSADVETPAA